MDFKDDGAYVVFGEQMNVLKRVNNRLYDDRSLSPDDRRDLANAMWAVLDKAELWEDE